MVELQQQLQRVWSHGRKKPSAGAPRDGDGKWVLEKVVGRGGEENEGLWGLGRHICWWAGVWALLEEDGGTKGRELQVRKGKRGARRWECERGRTASAGTSVKGKCEEGIPAFAIALQGRVQSILPCCFTALSPAVQQSLSPGWGGVNTTARLSELRHHGVQVWTWSPGEGTPIPWAVLPWA